MWRGRCCHYWLKNARVGCGEGLEGGGEVVEGRGRDEQ